MFSYGEFKAEDQEQMLKALNKKVEEVYRNTIGDNEANIRLDFFSLKKESCILVVPKKNVKCKNEHNEYQ